MTLQPSLLQPLSQRRILTVFLALTMIVLMAGCGIFGKEIDPTRAWTVEKLYAEAKYEMSLRNWTTAIKHYERIESRYPFGRFAQQSQIELAYVHWRNEDPALALAVIDRFIKQYPNHPSVDYMYYLKGRINFNDDLGITGLISNQDLSERDPKAAADAFVAFKDLVSRFPDSKYGPDALSRLNYLVNTLARNEIHVARYYMKRRAFVAAANRAQFVLKQYPGAPAGEEALWIMVQAYAAAGLHDLSEDARRVLDKNFPNSEFYRGGPQQERSWWRIWN
jgi:outer membrane protein assembly factor BamD